MADLIFKKFAEQKRDIKKNPLFELAKKPEDYILLAGIKNDEITIKIKKRTGDEPV